jgi:hypothetical protein
MRTIGVMTSSVMQIRILASTLRAITKMVDEHEVLMVYGGAWGGENEYRYFIR